METNQVEKLLNQSYQKGPGVDIFKIVKTVWYCLMSFWLWFNMVTSPFIMLWP